MLTISIAIAFGAPPESADPALSPWYGSLTLEGVSCCSLADCRPVEARIAGGGWEIFLGEKWLPVPKEKVLQGKTNPTGRPVACYTPERGILCFVEPPLT